MAFDAYHKWLGIPPAEQPPHHYRLLGIALFEDDAEVIESAADRQMAHVHTHKIGAHSELSQRLLNELAQAKLCLLNTEKKAAYDAELRSRMAAAVKPPSAQPNAQPLEAGHRAPANAVGNATMADVERLRAEAPPRAEERRDVDYTFADEPASSLETTADLEKPLAGVHERMSGPSAPTHQDLLNHPDYEVVKELGHGGMGWSIWRTTA